VDGASRSRAAGVRPASEAEKARLGELFEALCRIPSPFGHEQECAGRVVKELADIGVEAAADETGNLLAHIPGREERSVLLCAHMDTVEPAAPIEPVLVDGGWENANDGILGADNKAALAVMLALARRVMNPSHPPSPVGIELLFTVSEEDSLAGAKALDATRLRSRFGYVFDHATPIGEVITASPTAYRVDAEFRGKAAHAGIRPEDGRSAVLAAARAIAEMPLGRIDAETTANVGSVHGGVGTTNVVPDRCRLAAECRSLDPAKAERAVSGIIEALYDGAASSECDVDVVSEKTFAGYRLRSSAPELAAAESALRACGYEPRRIASGGGSDANALQAAGIQCICLANGTERAHEPTERVSVVALEGMLDVALVLLEEAAAA
jgi:tripeptide aminopeptidase